VMASATPMTQPMVRFRRVACEGASNAGNDPALVSHFFENGELITSIFSSCLWAGHLSQIVRTLARASFSAGHRVRPGQEWAGPDSYESAINSSTFQHRASFRHPNNGEGYVFLLGYMRPVMILNFVVTKDVWEALRYQVDCAAA